MKLGHVEGAVLAGGASRRMGRDKATIRYAGRTMVESVAHALARCVDPVRLVIRPDERAPLDLPVVRDGHAQRAALVGVAAALGASRAPAVLIAGCDQPDLDPRVLLLLLAATPAAASAPDLVCFETPDGPAPFPAVYHTRLLARIESRLESGALAMRALIADCDARKIPYELLLALDPEARSLRSLNTPEDLAHAEERIG